jgi:hypothetical protein
MCRRNIYLVSVVLLLSVVGASVADEIDPDLIGWWKFDEALGDTAVDSAGGDNNGTVIGDTWWVVDGKIGGALYLNDYNDTTCRVEIPTTGMSADEGAVTLFGRLSPYEPNTEGVTGFTRYFFGHTTLPYYANRIQLYMDATANTLDIGLGATHGLDVDVATLEVETWYHIALVWDEEGTYVVYVDGEEVTSGTYTGLSELNSVANIGNDGGELDEAFDGTLDDVRIYKKALTQGEVLGAMLSKAPTFAFGPNPLIGTEEVPRDVILSWRAADVAEKHDVYLGANFDDVNEASRDNDPNAVLVSQNYDGTTYDPEGLLEYNTTYYWRIDEINDADPNSPWKGEVWNFTTRNYIIVDDFEDYNNYEPDRIFDTWTDGWGIPENGSQVGYDSPPFAEQVFVHGGSQSMPLFYNNTAGIAYSEAVCTFDSPQDWTRDGVETLTLFFRGYPQAFVEEPAGTYTMGASGADVWDESDEFRFAYKILSGNGSITARVVSMDDTNGFAKAGVMIRGTLDPFSVHGFMFLTPNGRRAFQNRPVTGRESYSAHSDPNSISFPGWVRLTRQSIFFTAYYSEDGINWIQQPTDENTGTDASPNPRIIVMGADTYIGLAYCSHNADMTGTAVFSDVTITGTVTGDDWEVVDIGVEMGDNDPESLHVAVEDGAGTAKVFEHPDNPSAVLQNDWQQWDIPLSAFGDANVNLTEVQKLSIGVGNQIEPQTGEGKLYFDNLRLYRPEPSDPNATTEE